MNRKGEIVFSIIGAASSLIMIVIGLVFLYRKDKEAYLNYLYANWSESEVATSLNQMNQAGTLWVLPGVIGVALGVIAIILLKVKSSPTLTGWIFIIGSVVVCNISVFGFFPAMFFAIAGILALVKKVNVKK
ncbi:DUF4064 domain-containing protein [Brevibacillus laterosporus]|uniref:DUF4064 domain-containing protein n=1 Tax=Brevibacillus laterosporus TaxID=1465 RepID=UPI0026570968|nr:DUF4064 domain-containing protein [Brevibacillus laterosporus]MDN9012018.1 DUF4064 domain-containing protein [Brevibacillus laterosporus]MDO0943114.1 DUF4064 domain-containing protein [Brevibacillus laterosporus]